MTYEQWKAMSAEEQARWILARDRALLAECNRLHADGMAFIERCKKARPPVPESPRGPRLQMLLVR